MSTVIPTIEPKSVRAGDTWKWRREDLSAYPAPTWALKYRFKNAAGGFELTAAADGAQFAVTVAASASADHPAGTYDWVAWVEGAGEQYTVGTGRLTVEPDLRAGDVGTPLDLRSPARQLLEKLEAALLARDPSLAAYTLQTGSGSRTKQFTSLAEVRTEYEKVKADVLREDVAAAIARGHANPRKTFVRFVG